MSAMSQSRQRALLDERSLALARRGRIASSTSSMSTARFLVCRAGGEHVGLPLSEVSGVIAKQACRPLPNAPPALVGIVAIAGGIVSVLDLGLALGLDRGPAAHQHVVRLHGRHAAIALAVERAIGIVRVAEAAVSVLEPSREDAARRPALGSDAVSGYAARGAGTADGFEEGFVLIDPARLIRRFLP